MGLLGLEASGLGSPEHLTDHDPTEYAVTVNIRTAPGDEGARIKRWTIHVSVEDGKKLTRTYADVLGAILLGGTDTKTWEDAKKLKIPELIVHNCSPFYAPVIQPTLTTGVDAPSLVALTFLTEG